MGGADLKKEKCNIKVFLEITDPSKIPYTLPDMDELSAFNVYMHFYKLLVGVDHERATICKDKAKFYLDRYFE